MSDHPALELRRPLRVGNQVEVKRGVYAGHRGCVAEVLDPPDSDTAFMGCARYGILLGCAKPDHREVGDNITDFALHEIKRIR